MTRVTAASVVNFIEGWLRVPEGKLVGQPIRLAPFQIDFIERVYDNPAGTRRAILSTARKNSKTTTCACLLLNHLCGPGARDRPNSQLYSTAQSRDQAALVFGAAAKMIRMHPDLARSVKIQETAKTLSCPELGTQYRALSADATTAMGLSPQFTIHDELGQIRGPRGDLYAAIESATGAVVDPLSVVISTQAATDGDLLSVLIDDAIAGHDPHTVIRLHAAGPELDPFSDEAIRAANPAFDFFMNQTEIRSMAEGARRMPSSEAQYRNLNLNQRVEASSPFLAKDVWQACGAEPRDLRGCRVFGGLDLSSVGDLTCLVLAGVDPFTGSWSVVPFFWLPSEGLAERARADRVPFDLWAERGLIELTPGRTVSYEYVAARLKEIIALYQVKRIGFDPWHMEHLSEWLTKIGFSAAAIKEQFWPCGQGYKSMSPAMRVLEGLALEQKLRHGNHAVLTMCVANSVVETDAAGNRKLTKKRSSGRIDGAVALLMALAASPMQPPSFDVNALIG